MSDAVKFSCIHGGKNYKATGKVRKTSYVLFLIEKKMKFVCLIRGSRHIRLGLPDHLKFFQERFVFQRDTVGYFHGSPQEGLKGNLLPLKIGLRIGIPYFCD